jgi:hypothetical protein
MLGSLATMTQSRRLPSRREIPWDEVRRRAGIAFQWLQDGWNELTTAEREEIRKLVTKSRGRPRNLTKAETRRLGQLASRAATGAAKRARR